MKIFIYGDSNTCGQVPNLEGYSKSARTKFYSVKDIWWYRLSKDNYVVVNALPGRAIDDENPWLEGRNAMRTIRQDLGCFCPDLIIIQLGTNDCKSCYGHSAKQITEKLGTLVDKMLNLVGSAKFLILSPAKVIEGNKITDKYYVGAGKKCEQLDRCYKKFCKENGFDFISGLNLEVGEDGEHLTKQGHAKLAKAIEEFLRSNEDFSCPEQ